MATATVTGSGDHVAGSDASGPGTTLRLVGRRLNKLGDTIALALVCGYLAYEASRDQQNFPLFILIFLLGRPLLFYLRALLRPPRLSLENGRFTLKFFRFQISCLAGDVHDITVRGESLTVRLARADRVLPETTRERFRAQGTGAGFSIGGDFFTLADVNRLRRALGLAEQSEESSRGPLQEFEHRARALTPHLLCTPFLVAANLVVFAVVVLSGVDMLRPDTPDLIEWGANLGARTLTTDWWRLGSCMFLHAGILHLLINMWALWGLGRIVERVVGNVGFLVLYAGSGLLASCASILWSPLPSVGASGAIFGVVGMFFCLIVRAHGLIPEPLLKQLRTRGLYFLGITLLFGWSVPNIDNAAHLGGLAAGFLLGFLLAPPPGREPAARRWQRIATAGVLSAAGVLAVLQLAPVPKELVHDPVVLNQRFNELGMISAMFEGQRNRYESGNLPAKEFELYIEGVILPRWKEQSAVFDQGHIRPEVQEYVRVRFESLQLTLEAVKTEDKARFAAAKRRWAESAALLRKLTAEGEGEG